MRITGGKFARQTLQAPKGDNTRPATDRTREALFNILSHGRYGDVLDGARVLDLFAGSGSYGFESLSRGAQFCLFVELAAGARGAIRENIDHLGLFGHSRIHRRSATSLGQRPASFADPFDLVFLDPPYGTELGAQALAGLRGTGWLSEDALVLYECGAKESPKTPGFELLDERIWGAAKVLFLRALDIA